MLSILYSKGKFSDNTRELDWNKKDFFLHERKKRKTRINLTHPPRLLLIVITICQNKHNLPIKKRTINNHTNIGY